MSVISKLRLIAKLRNKDYRDAYVEEKVATSLPFQIRALREQSARQWSQAELGRRAEMRQNAISRLEDAESGTPSISTLLRLARAFDVALLVKFVPFSKLLSEFSDLSFEALSVPSFDEELPQLEQAAIQSRTGFVTVLQDTTLRFAPEYPVRSVAVSTGARVIIPTAEQVPDFLLTNSTGAEMVSTEIH